REVSRGAVAAASGRATERDARGAVSPARIRRARGAGAATQESGAARGRSPQSSWVAFSRFPGWVRIGIYCWLAIVLMQRGCSSSERPHAPPKISSAEHPFAPPKISSPQAEKLRDLTERLGVNHPGPWTPADTAQFISQIAKVVPEDAGDSTDDSAKYAPVLAIPFATPTDDEAARKLARSAFGQIYGTGHRPSRTCRIGRQATADSGSVGSYR